MPDTLSAWADIEVESDKANAWLDPAITRFCNLMLVSSYFVDNKIAKLPTGDQMLYRFARVANFIYRPIARFRLRRGIDQAFVEWWLYCFFTQFFMKTSDATPASNES